ncbi:MAG: dihydrodipicolinate reductase C-terminal domain-containing protein [Candidatus Omnitrophota bacterium]
MIKICVSGSRGKMGSRIIALAKEDPAFGEVEGFDIDDDPSALIARCDCLIEFSAPFATIEHLQIAERQHKAVIIGTTGLSEAERSQIAAAGFTIPVVFSANMSVGVNCLFKEVENAARTLGAAYKARIKEAHHVHKKDAPSGTAKELARIIMNVRHEKDIPIESIREGEIVGDHWVTFESSVDTLELFHHAKTRDIFVRGALEAAKFIVGKPAKVYSMQDVLGIKGVSR